MKNKYIYYNDKKIPTKYVVDNPKWVWMNKDWLGDLSQISTDHVEYATEIEKDLKVLEQIAGQEFLNQYIIDSYSKELESSWRIEGEYLNSQLIKSCLIKSLALDLPEWFTPKKNVRSERENQAVKAALYLLNSKENLSLQLLLDTHKIIGQSDSKTVSGNFGELRVGTEIVGRLSKDQSYYEIVFEAPPAQEVLPLMNNFLAWWIESYKRVPICIGAALAHLYFVEIHPFHDGNGRMARLLLDKYFANNRNTFRPFSMQSVLHTHRFDNEHTLKENSAITGVSLSENCEIVEDNDKFIINNREQLLPYICVSSEILNHASDYYMNLNNYSVHNEISDYLYYMLMLQESAIKGALKRVPLLKDLAIFFQRNKHILNDNEKSIIKNCYLATDVNFVNFIHATSEIEDNYAASQAWNKLLEVGLINKRGKAVLDNEIAAKLNSNNKQQ